MLAIQNVRIQYGSRVLFKDLSFVIQGKERVALVGPNGAGKSTLMKVVNGNITPDGGRIVKAKAVRIGYLAQEGIESTGKTLMEEAESAFGDIMGIQERMDSLAGDLETLDHESSEYVEAIERIEDLKHQLEEHDVSRIRPRIETVLRGLGFKGADFDRMTDEFSGGWQMRIALSKLLLQEPEVLMLDEPTNHLDIEAQRWLENYLDSYRGAVLLISHDRAFLDTLCKRTIAFGNGRVEEYAGNYSFYEKESIVRREQLEKAAANQQREIEKTEDFINRFRAKATKAKQVQSRIKMLEKVERIELEHEGPEIKFKFPPAPPSGQSVVKLEGVSKHYGSDKKIINDWTFTVEKGDRIAVVGVNGAGKSTFSRIVAGKEPLTAGDMTFGHNVILNHFAQDQAEELDSSLTALETLEQVDTQGANVDKRSILGCFLFRGDDVFKSVSVLSGGERGRLALAKMLLSPSNFLILDEPTNHLDMQSQDRLRSALQDYEGSFAIVSHNRDFLDPLVNKVLEFRLGAPPRLYLGNVSDYIEKREQEERELAKRNAIQGENEPVTSSSSAGGSGTNRKEQRRIEAEKRQKRSQVLKPLQDDLETLEEQIAEMEKMKAEMVERMNDLSTFESKEEAQLFLQRFRDNDAELEKAYSGWSELSEEIEKLEAEIGQ